ncbi:hypothetical protein [Ornithinimicrobium kibberense]|uniref:hypothetical protein n=1 Tax=Ornithinimicrobium kibberense TaxID=282060 RepID=UPI0036227432
MADGPTSGSTCGRRAGRAPGWPHDARHAVRWWCHRGWTPSTRRSAADPLDQLAPGDVSVRGCRASSPAGEVRARSRRGLTDHS